VFVNRVLGGILGIKREKDGENCITRSFMVSDRLTRRTRWAGHMAPRREVKCLKF